MKPMQECAYGAETIPIGKSYLECPKCETEVDDSGEIFA